jgi:hypothetical protein
MSVDIAGFAMLQISNTVGPALIASWLCWLAGVASSPLHAQAAGVVPVNIYGDGNPLNGIEDNREQLGKKHGIADPSMNAGTIHCEGKFRGTAMVIDSREFAEGLKGVVLLSAAHVFYDLKKKRPFRRCEFHFMGWEDKSSYRSRINMRNMRMGDFSPRQETATSSFGEGDWAFLYLRKPWKRFKSEQSLRVRDFSFAQTESYQQSGGEFRLLAFDSTAGVISESRNCTVLESDEDDLGGGRWKGQLLDDCDSTDGASGGGIIAVLNGQKYLIGIRSGSHWSEEVYPADIYPLGPPDGSVWDRRLNTNFGRAIDKRLLSELDSFIQKHSK